MILGLGKSREKSPLDNSTRRKKANEIHDYLGLSNWKYS